MAKAGVKFQLQWDQDPRPVLEGLRKAMQNKIVKNALGPTTEKMETDFRRAAPKDRGTMKLSVGRRVKRTRKGKKVWIGIVGPRSKFSVPVIRKGKAAMRNGKPLVRKPSKYAHLVERGHRFPRKRKGSLLRKAGRAVVRFLGLGGRVKAHPFMKPLFQRKRSHYGQVMTAWLRYGVNDYLKRQRKPKT